MYSTICVECFNDIPVAYGDCPYCKIAAHEHNRITVDGDETKAAWSLQDEVCPFPHEIKIRKRASAALSLMTGAAISSLILVYSMSTPTASLGNPQDLPSWAVTHDQPELAPKWSNEARAALKEANSDLLQRRTTRR